MTIHANNENWKVPVEVLPLTQAFPVLDTIKEFREKTVVVTQDHSRLFGVVSSKTPVLFHKDVLNTFNDAAKEFFGEEQSIDVLCTKEGAAIKATLQFPDHRIVLNDGDTSYLKVLIYNSYDKSISFQLRTGALRTACENSMVLGTGFGKINSRDLVDGFSPETLTQHFNRVLERGVAVKETWELWNGVSMDADLLTSLIERKLPGKFVDQALSSITFPNSVWEVYNGLTSIATHGFFTDRTKSSVNDVLANIFYSPRSPLMELFAQDDLPALIGEKIVIEEEQEEEVDAII